MEIFFLSVSLPLFCLFYFYTSIAVLLIFYDVFRSSGAFSGWRSKLKLPPLKIALDERDQKQQRASRRQIVRGRCKVFLISILECDFAWWEIKSKLVQAHWSYRGAFVRVHGPSCKSGCLVPGARVQPALPLCFHMQQISLWQAQEFTAAVKSQAPETTPPPINHRPTCCNPASDLSVVVVTKLHIFEITGMNFLVLNRGTIARSYRVSPHCQHCDSHPATLECTDDSALWSFLTRLFTEVAKWAHVSSISLSSPGA